ncbi:GMC family oxidoreductase N-terminal domain-containing protein [Vulgatibacter incomptus]|uniref:Oxidoreductase, GMC family n=1 Tax=Vulgatibacter incomptus TaxID=1391653 RepID=A0A0K1P872_9BACT|nr:GMC family oxidoreductase [Vulgatibacter incomptus]AKU89723.1 Oxidoreductase, GMC family [Vulgatibacter incomptus]
MFAEPTSILEGRDHPGDLTADVDVAIVGSGAAGSVAAKILAEAGMSVLVLEEGGYVTPERYAKFRPTETMRNMFRDAGSTAAIGLGDTPLISILAGRTVGGSSTLTGGVIFRIPESILSSWVRDHGLVDYAPELMEEAYRSVEQETYVETVTDDMRSRSTTLFGEGAQKLGYSLKPMRRNTKGCRGSSRCNFGCPHRAKMSVDVTYLAKARSLGAMVISDCKVTRLVIEGERITGVEGRLLGAEGEKRGKVRVHARKVLIAGSALSTPLLLKGAGVGRWTRSVGRNLTLHPGFRVAALFDQDVSPWKGALQSAYSDAFEDQGLTLNSVFAPVNVLAAMFPGVGPDFQRYTSQMRQLATFGAMVHDDGGGQVWRMPGGRSVITYRMSKRDKLRMLKGIRLLAETFFAAGAREVLLPLFGVRPMKDADELRFLDDPSFPARRFECMTFHPLGTARMGLDPSTSVVKPDGETHDVRGLYVIDGSVFPSSIGVNSQLPIMAVATKLAWGIREATSSARACA